MNRARRKQIEVIAARLEAIKGEIETLQNDEQEYADNMPDNLQGSERHEKAETAADALQEAVDGVDEVITTLQGALE